jgi:uncharacterized repeat protein (TIGR01451 family)
MKMMKKLQSTVLVSVLAAMLPAMAQATPSVDYSIKWDNTDKRYRVYMKPLSVPSPNASTSAQITIKAPYTSDAGKFQASNIQNPLAGVVWSAISHIHAPTEDENASYISFTASISSLSAFNWQAGTEIEVLSFTNNGLCLGDISLLAGGDAFNYPNSVGTNPDNYFFNMGWGTDTTQNHYRQNYGSAAECTVFDEGLTVIKTADKPSAQAGETLNYSISVTNGGPENATNLSIKEALPKNVTHVSNTATHGSYSPMTGLWTIGTLNNGEQAILDIAVEVQ